MKEWYNAAEISSTLKVANSSIFRRARKEGWQARKREGQGGGLEYHIGSLPKSTQKSLKISHAKRSVSFQRGVATAAELASQEKAEHDARIERLNNSLLKEQTIRGKARQRVDAKQEIILAAEDFMRISGQSGRIGLEMFTCAYNSGDVRLERWVHEVKPSFSVATLYNWFKAEKNGGRLALAGTYGHRKGTGIIDTQPDLAEYVIGMLVDKPHISNKVLLRAIRAEFSGQSITLPSDTTLRRWVESWKKINREVFTAITNPDEWKNKFMAAPGSASEDVKRLNQLWEFDATPADLLLIDGRHTINGVIDVYSRRLKLIVSKNANSKAVAQVIRDAILDWGVPEVAKTDNGSDYKSKHIKAIFYRLEVDQKFCLPFHGWQKPHIERVFRTFSHDIAELLQGFIGHNVSERKAIEARKSFSDRLFKKDELIEVKLTSTELQDFCNRWIDAIYHREVHGELKKTPLEMVRAWQWPVSKVEDERLLDILLSEPVGTRTITKKGIKLEGSFYIHPLLFAHTGEEVQVYFDDADMGRLFVYDCYGEFICIAEDPSLTGVSRAEVAAKAKEIQREAVQEERRRLKAAAKKVTKRDVALQILAHEEQLARADKVLDLPKRAQSYESDGLNAAQATINAQDGLPEMPRSAYEQSLHDDAEKKLAEITTLYAAPKQPEGQEQLYTRWLSLDDQLTQGDPLSEKDARFHVSFPMTPDFKVMQKLEEIGMYQRA